MVESYKGVTAVQSNLVSAAVTVNTQKGDETQVVITKMGIGSDLDSIPTVSLQDGLLVIAQPKAFLVNATSWYTVTISVPTDSYYDYDLHSVSGHVHLDAPSTRAYLVTTSGSVCIGATVVDAHAKSVSGNIKIFGDDRTKAITANNTSGSIRVAAGNNVESIYAQGTSGSIHIKIPEKLGYTFDYQNVSGSIKDMYRDKRYKKEGTAIEGDGQVSITAINVSGSIKIENWY